MLGGGVALKHYVDFRTTHDIDAWWLDNHDTDAAAAILDAVRTVAKDHGFGVRVREWRESASYEMYKPGVPKQPTVFSFQVATRDVQLDPPLPTAWPPIQVETLADNIGAKMNALVDRGAPRDFLDIYEIVVVRGIATATECWDLWQRKNPSLSVEDAKNIAVRKIVGIEQRTPLEMIAESERLEAEQRRAFFKGSFLESAINQDGYSL